jgi:signal peptidase I
MKKIILISLILLVGCSKPDLPEPIGVINPNVFSVSESKVENGQTIYFDLPSDGEFFLTLTDKETNQVIGREKFYGKFGENMKKLYTNSIESKYLYLSLEDITKKELKKTIIIIKN